jgi:hypothetical protein
VHALRTKSITTNARIKGDPPHQSPPPSSPLLRPPSCPVSRPYRGGEGVCATRNVRLQRGREPALSAGLRRAGVICQRVGGAGARRSEADTPPPRQRTASAMQRACGRDTANSGGGSAKQGQVMAVAMPQQQPNAGLAGCGLPICPKRQVVNPEGGGGCRRLAHQADGVHCRLGLIVPPAARRAGEGT